MKINRVQVYNKFNGHCGYCGKSLELKDMQIDHVIPKHRLSYNIATYEDVHNEENHMPTCRRCNHYKRDKNLEEFREFMKSLHIRLSNDYIFKVAVDYDLVTIKPFIGNFYFETLNTMS